MFPTPSATSSTRANRMAAENAARTEMMAVAATREPPLFATTARQEEIVGRWLPPAARDQEPMVTFQVSSGGLQSLQRPFVWKEGAFLTPSFVSNLQTLRIGCRDPTYARRMALLPFLSCISSFTRLTSLELENCFVPPAPGQSRIGASAPYSAKHLKKVTIEDHPSSISAVLSVFVLPTSCDVSLKGNLRDLSREQCRFAYKDMLPPDTRCLPILRGVSSLIVTLDPRAAQYEFYAETPSGAVISLDIMLRSPLVARDNSRLGDPEGILDSPDHGRFFEQMVSCMPREVFPRAPIQSVTFLGNVGAVPYQSWVAALAQFPALKKLAVDDMTLYNHLRDVIAALRTATPTNPPRPVCPSLEEIELFGDGGQQLDVHELDTIRDCLAWRKAHGGPAVLKNFRIGLFYKVGQAAERSERVERIKRAFEPFTRRFTFEIYVQPGRRVRDE